MKIWLRILGGAYIVVGSLNSFVFLFIVGVYSGKGGIGAIRAEEYLPVIGHLGGWILYVLLGFSVAGILAGVGLLKLWAWCGSRIASSCGQSFCPPVWDHHRIGDDSHSAFKARPSAPASCSLETVVDIALSKC